MQGPLGVVLLCDRGAENDRQRVARERFEAAAGLVDLGLRRLAEALEQERRPLGVVRRRATTRRGRPRSRSRACAPRPAPCGGSATAAAGRGRVERGILPQDRRLELGERRVRLDPELVDERPRPSR